MNVRALLRPVRRLWPQKVRTRLTLLYAALFLAAGSALLGLTYVLVARVRSLARRAPAAAPVIVRGDIVLDRARRRVSRAGRPLSLTRKEMGILEELLVADGGVVSTEDLLERVWDENADPFTRTVTVTIGRLRRKLGEPDPIDTVTGSGYRLP